MLVPCQNDRIGLGVLANLGGKKKVLDFGVRRMQLCRLGQVFLLVGDGAERDNLIQQRDKMGLSNVLMLPQQPKKRIPQIISASNACMVLLIDRQLFQTVIPSKIFEIMAMQRPIILGVRGESQSIIERAKCGLCVEPENEKELADAVLRLYENRDFSNILGNKGFQFVKEYYDRDKLALDYLETLKKIQKENCFKQFLLA